MPHSIKLRGPWDYEPLARTVVLPNGTRADVPGELPPSGKVTAPSDWGAALGPEFRGRVRYRRRFNCPTGLTEFTTVGLVVEAVDFFGRVTLNGTVLGEMQFGGPAGEYDVSTLLQPHNVLEIEVELPVVLPPGAPFERSGRERLPGGLIGEVRLEIYAA